MFDLPVSHFLLKLQRGQDSNHFSAGKEVRQNAQAFACLETAGLKQIPFSQAVQEEKLLKVFSAVSHLQEHWLLSTGCCCCTSLCMPTCPRGMGAQPQSQELISPFKAHGSPV